MNLLLDNIIFSLQHAGGISMLWSKMLDNILLEDEFNVRFLEYDNHNFFRRNTPVLEKHILNKKKLWPNAIERYLQPSIKDFKGVFHSSYYRYINNSNVCNITTVHDFTYEYFRRGLPKYIHSYQKSKAILNSDSIICVSEHTKLDLLKFYPKISPSKITVVYNGIDEVFNVDKSDEILKKYIPFESKEYLLFVGERAGYKNFDMVVEASLKLQKPLVIVGPSLTKKEKTELDIKLSIKYVALGDISSNVLNSIYNHALCLLYPSSYEGFGLPIVEAQNAGCPVIASNTSSIPEVIGKGGIMLDTINSDKICEGIQVIDKSSSERDHYIKKGLENGKRFSWDTCYQQTKATYLKYI